MKRITEYQEKTNNKTRNLERLFTESAQFALIQGHRYKIGERVKKAIETDENLKGAIEKLKSEDLQDKGWVYYLRKTRKGRANKR